MIYVMLAEGFEEIEALTPVDILRRCKFGVTTVSYNRTEKVTGSHGITVTADTTIKELMKKPPCDMQMVVFPGGMPGTMNLHQSEYTDKILCDAVAQSTYIGAICAAPMILGQRGLLNGKKACCYPGFEDKLLGAEVVTDPAVIDGKIITARGMGKALDFALALVEALCGKDDAELMRASVIA